ncbi:hypothetical protein AVEN_229710-1 [Araneus ventricosus]|uniref:DNA-directed DNA polymerase n=1 Tax=Araneus ventricosus TaxID=182803 RepID=A0A4Y2R682_ARAVE|nr:hypothetical protein AVEN_229710-1 [Araneus ventricosus]
MAWLLEQGIAPPVIPSGSKVMSINHPTFDIKFIDSFNFLPTSLSKLPGCFGMTELKKGYIPHLFNKEENQTYFGPFPDIHYYSPDTMSGATRTNFHTRYNSQEGQQFDFQHEMLTYCRSDVDILRYCLQLRNEFIKITDVDPFCYVTIASVCMAAYRSKHLEKETTAMVPVRGYTNHTNYSPDAIRWLDFIAIKENIFIEHALNRKGERKIDRFCEETNTVYQFHGCIYHGCPDCFEGDTLNSLTGATMKTLFERTANTTARLRNRGYTVIEEWEHTYQKRLKRNLELKQFVSDHELQDRLNPRDAFYGGRTNAVKLYFEGKTKYVDFTSLYPSIKDVYLPMPDVAAIVWDSKKDFIPKILGLIFSWRHLRQLGLA